MVMKICEVLSYRFCRDALRNELRDIEMRLQFPFERSHVIELFDALPIYVDTQDIVAIYSGATIGRHKCCWFSKLVWGGGPSRRMKFKLCRADFIQGSKIIYMRMYFLSNLHFEMMRLVEMTTVFGIFSTVAVGFQCDTRSQVFRSHGFGLVVLE